MRFLTNTFNDADRGDTLTYTATKSDGAMLPTWLELQRLHADLLGHAGDRRDDFGEGDSERRQWRHQPADEFSIVVRTVALGHCRSLDPLELWCASMTVGTRTVSGTNLYGYIDLATDIGALSDTQFTYESVTYTINDIHVEDSTLTLGLIPTGASVFDLNARLTLRIGTTDYSFGSIDFSVSEYVYNGTGPSWSDGDTVALKLLRVAPTAANKTVTTEADMDYPFAADDFNLLDTEYAVKIVRLPGRGTLKLDGVPVRTGNSVSHARVDAGYLTYTPPRGQVGDDMSNFNFRVNDGELDSTRAYRIVIDVDNKLAGNLGQTADGTAISLPDGSYNAYAQRFRTGSSVQELEEVKLAITVPSGTTPKVSIWYDGETKPEGEVTGLALSNPSNIHTSAATVKTFKANSKTNGRYSLATDSENYWIVVHRASGSGTISLKRTATGSEDAGAPGWALKNEYRRRTGGSTWTSSGVSFALQAELRTVPGRQLSAYVLDMELLGPGEDNLYTHGENLDIAVTFNEPVDIPEAKITAPLVCGGDANDLFGHDTNRIVFRCRIKGGPYTQVEVRANSLMPGGSGDGSRVSDAHPAFSWTTDVHGVTGPVISDVRVSSPGSDGVWTPGETLEVRYTFDAPMTVGTRSGRPVVWIQRVYASGAIYGEEVRFKEIDPNDANTLVFAKTLSGNERATALKIPANSVYLKHGVIAGTSTKAIAVFTHREYHIEPGPACGGLPDEIWCAELTVGGVSNANGFVINQYGSLSHGQFNYGGTEYSVQQLRHDASGSQLFIVLLPTTGHSIINNAGFRLHLGAHSYSFPASGPGNVTLFWNNVDSFWTPGDRVFVRLVKVAIPTVEGAPAVSEAGGRHAQWTDGETVEVTLTFSEAVEVDATNGVPSVGISLGGSAARSAAYLRGSGTSELVFGYTLVTGDGDHGEMAVTQNSLALNGGTIRSVAAAADAALGHNGTTVSGNQVEVEAPTVEGIPSLSVAGWRQPMDRGRDGGGDDHFQRGGRCGHERRNTERRHWARRLGGPER